MERGPGESHRWGVILAGGNGERLRRLTKFIAGDDRPKQFCPLLEGGRTLLEGTRERVAQAVDPQRTLYLLTAQHEAFYAKPLSDVAPSRLVVQPCNRGTLAAITCGVVEIFHGDPDAVVAFFPSDHHYSRDEAFLRAIRSGYAAAERFTDSVVLMGTTALFPDTGYGYIEPGLEMQGAGEKLARVARFWEKPAEPVARSLTARGCLWNTFVMFGSVSAFLRLIEKAEPEFYGGFEPLFSAPSAQNLERVFQQIPAADFSALILSSGAASVAVLDVGDIGWSDMGDPHRVIATLSAFGIPSPWHQLWLREMGIAPVAG
jgi:mannose-1-phosphate guanylyltransferase